MQLLSDNSYSKRINILVSIQDQSTIYRWFPKKILWQSFIGVKIHQKSSKSMEYVQGNVILDDLNIQEFGIKKEDI